MFRLANSIATINEALRTKKLSVTVTGNTLFLDVLKILLRNNFISSFTLKIINYKMYVTIFFYSNSQITFRSIKLVSKPSSHVSIKYYKISTYLKKSNTFLILSTNVGLLSAQEAHLNRIGGKVLCVIN